VPETTNEPGAVDADISGLQTVVRAEEERMSEGESQRSCFLNFGDIDELILGDDNDIATSHASSKLANVQRSTGSRAPSQALA
jgi:hypothetical protein